jgi:nicotinamidase-related amidase
VTTEQIAVSKTALLLMDYQPAILSRQAGADTAVARAQIALARARQAGVRVVFVRAALTPQDFGSITPRNKFFARFSDGSFLADGAPENDIDPRLHPEDDDIVLTKTRFGSFSTTGLSTHLTARDIDTLILAGVSTGGVVLSTVRDAADRDYRLILLADACTDQPEVHDVLVERVFPSQADVIEVDDLDALFG